MENTQILVSGGGIAGSTLAHWLRRRGVGVTVVERAAAPRCGGQAVDLRGAGRTVVARMGLAERAREITLDQKGIAWVDGRGRVTARMPVDAFDGEGIVSEVEILRGDLAAVLTESATGVEYLYDDSVIAVDEDADGVTVTFEKAPPRRVALVVGADGLHSAVRTLTFGTAGLRPLGCHVAWFTAPAAPDLDGWYLMHNSPGGLVVSLRPGRLPGETKAGLGFRSSDSRTSDTARREPAAWVDEFAARFAGVGWKAGRLVDAMRSAPDLAVSPVAQVHLPRWSRGRVVLVGDAGYSPSPLTGLGTSLALVGAYVLAGELAAAGGDHRVAFPRYEQVLRPYVTQAQQLPPGGVNGFAPRSRLAIRAQAATMRAMTRWPVRPLLERQFAKADAIELPDYPEPALVR
jgi:2-polyprenyl-6-methoxyphenol hydroxylase-like FAD-dependent oxidoreductase